MLAWVRDIATTHDRPGFDVPLADSYGKQYVHYIIAVTTANSVCIVDCSCCHCGKHSVCIVVGATVANTVRALKLVSLRQTQCVHCSCFHCGKHCACIVVAVTAANTVYAL